MRNFIKIDPFDYVPIRVGLRYIYKAIVIDYQLKSSGKRYLHNIKVGKYSDPKAFGVSVSRSGTFAEALNAEVSRVVDEIYGDHYEYLPPERIQRVQIEGLVNDLLVFNQTKRKESLKDWNEVQHPERRSSLKDKSSISSNTLQQRANTQPTRSTLSTSGKKSSLVSPDMQTANNS